MTRMTSLAIATILLALFAIPAHAQLARTFVSSLGSDANDCNRLTPCRNFQRAHDQTLASGEITVLDPGGYGALTITKGISIINDGVGEAGVLVSGGLTGITINAGANDAVTLRGLTIKGIGFGGGQGIVFNSGKSLTVENCTIRNFDNRNPAGVGINFQPTTSAATLAVTNTTITDNADQGIRFNPGGNATRGILDRVNLFNNADGLLVARAFVTVTESIASNNATGFHAQQTGGLIVLQRSAAVSNGIGIEAFIGGRIIVNESLVFRNNRGWQVDPSFDSQIFSYGNNVVAGNASNEGVMPVFAAR